MFSKVYEVTGFDLLEIVKIRDFYKWKYNANDLKYLRIGYISYWSSVPNICSGREGPIIITGPLVNPSE